MNSDLIEITEENIDYPIGLLKDIKIYFMHYSTFENAKNKWNERKTRMDYENLFILFTNRNGCTKEDLIEFDKLDYKNKIVFVNKKTPDIKSAIYIPGFEDEDSIGLCMNYKGKYSIKKYYDSFNYIEWFNNTQKTFEK